MATTSVVSSGDPAGDRDAVLEIQDSVCCGRHTFVLRGELDLANAAALENLIQRLCSDGARSLSLELDLAFMDSSGLRALLAGYRLCQQSDCEMTIQLISPAVRRLFEVAGVLHQLPVEPSAQPNA
jgi:anti-anti-sigma factor